MSTRPASTRSRQAVKRRGAGGRLTAVVVTALLATGAAVVIAPLFHHAVTAITLPLRHEDIIRQQARDKGIDPSLIAAVIYAESHFRDGQTSSAGAEGLMQITPDTAKYIARKSGGIAFVVKDLGTPQVNISYGSYYLRYLLRRYQNVTLALAAYNGGEGNVDSWVARAGTAERALTTSAIPFPETREYVRSVLDARTRYRNKYAAELGL
jgi:soluble lytic murein transglycosylase